MDIEINSKPKRYYPKYLILFGITMALVFGYRYLHHFTAAEFNIDKQSIVVQQVKYGTFNVSVHGSGLLVPEQIRWLSVNVDAKVEHLHVKPGNQVKEGQILLELSNPRLVQSLTETNWELEALEAEFQAARVTQESQILNNQAAVLNAKLDYESSQLKYDAETELLQQSSGAVSLLTYQRSKLDMEQKFQRWQISQQELNKMEETVSAQNTARAARLNKIKKQQQRLAQQVEELTVRASMDSVVQAMPLEIGQQVRAGGNLAKLAQQDSLYAKLKIPETQIRNVAVGQTATINTRNNLIAGVVSRIDPAVIGGNVEIDIQLTSDLSADARPELSVEGVITVTQVNDTLYVARPLFVQSEQTSTFYKLSEDGLFAERIPVVAGVGSAEQIQILDGLNAGDKIITSDPSRFNAYQKIRIN